MSKYLPPISVVSPAVVRILGCNPGKFTLQGTNTYLIGSGKQRILLDTGEGLPEYSKLLGDYLNLTGIEVSHVLLTHWHGDHTGGVPDLVLKNGLKRDSSVVAPLVYKMPDESDDPNNLKVRDQPFLPIHDGQVFETEGATLVAHYTPGHTNDHMSFFLEEEKAVFPGDNILGEGTSVFSDLARYIETLQKTKRINGGDIAKLYPGHGDIVLNVHEKIDEYILHRQQREDQILDMLKRAQTSLSTQDITKSIYPTVPEHVLRWAENGIWLHLEKLRLENKAACHAVGEWVASSREKL